MTDKRPDKQIGCRIPADIHDHMTAHPEVNWAAIMRAAIISHLAVIRDRKKQQ